MKYTFLLGDQFNLDLIVNDTFVVVLLLGDQWNLDPIVNTTLFCCFSLFPATYIIFSYFSQNSQDRR